MPSRPSLAPLFLAAGLAAGGCAYTTSSVSLPPHLHTIAIPVFENSTTQYSLEQDLTEAIVRRFVSDNRLRVVDERSADAVVHGKIVGYKNSVFGISPQNLAQEYRVTIQVQVVFKDQVKNREIWSDQNLVKYSNYYVQNVPGQTASTELDGRRAAIEKIADDIVTRSIQGW